MNYKTDLEILRETKLKHIKEIAESISLSDEDVEFYGKYKAKIRLEILSKDLPLKKQKLILVSTITPTAAGEGKTTVSIGLAQGLARIGKSVSVVLRQPSLGPTLGIKGGATGGGYSQIAPMDEINIHFTGDFYAVESAHNLLTAMIDNHIYHGNELKIDPRMVTWRHVLDVNDRSLRNIIIGLGGKGQGIPRESGFDITASSEVMAILCLSDSMKELKIRLGNILVGFTYDDVPVTANDLKAVGAMAVLLKDALKPNLVQTLEGVPAFVHGGPFANIAQGTNSIIATKMALKLTDYVVTEAGFGFDLGAEKFFDIVSPYGNLNPSMVILVATVRALKMHGGADFSRIKEPDSEAVKRGLPNLQKHFENIKKFNMPCILAINKFTSDTEDEIKVILNFCREMKGDGFVVNVWERGGYGAIELSEKVVEYLENNSFQYKALYDWNDTVENKIFKIASEIYGAEEVDYLPKAKKDLERIYRLGYDNLPVCIAKTQRSLSDNPELIGRPEDFTVTVREILIAGGAGFLIPMTGEILRMPGLPKSPIAGRIDIDESGNITGLF